MGGSSSPFTLRGVRRRRKRLVWNPDPGVLCVVRVLVLLQGGFVLLSTLEVALMGLFTGTIALLVPTVALTGGAAAVVLLLGAGLGRRSYLARRLVIAGEVLVVVAALVDLALAIVLAQAPLDPVPLLTRLVLPVAVIVLLRRSRTRVPVPLGAGA
jgi:hypothetical protein